MGIAKEGEIALTMSTAVQHLEFRREVMGPLAGLARKIKLYAITQGVCRCILIFAGCAALAFFLDRLLLLGVGPRAAMLLITVSLLGYVAYKAIIRPALVRIDPADIASLVERHHPGLRDRLLTAVAFASERATNPKFDSPAMVESIIAQSKGEFSRVSVAGLLRRDRQYLFSLSGLAAVAAFVIFSIVRPELAIAFVKRDLLLRDEAWPSSIQILVSGFEGGKLRWPIGDELTLTIKAIEGTPAEIRAEFVLGSSESNVRDMERRGDEQFVLNYGPLSRSLRLRFLVAKWGVDERTGWYEIEAVERPGVRDISIQVTPPIYTDQPSFNVAKGQASADVLRGSSVQIAAELTKPVIAAVLKSRTDESQPVSTASFANQRLEASLTPERDDTYYFDIQDADGLHDTRPVTYSIRLLNDPPPKVKLALPGSGEMLVSNAIPMLEVHCEDNLGLRSISLMRQVTRASQNQAVQTSVKTQEELPEFVSKQTDYGILKEFPLLGLVLQPGDLLTLQVKATDFQPPSLSSPGKPGSTSAPANLRNVGESVAYTLRIVTPEQLLAEIGRRESEWRQEFEQIAKSQEQLQKRLLDLRDSGKAAALSATNSSRYAQEARAQRQQTRRTENVIRQFEMIFGELKINQLATPVARKRLEGNVIRPLRQLVQSEMSQAVELMNNLAGQFAETQAGQLEQVQTQIVRRMYEVLSNMEKWEGYNEAVTLLKDIMQLQGEVNQDTQQRLNQEMERLFGPRPTSRPADPPDGSAN